MLLAEAVVDFSLVEGRCSVVCGENIQTDMDDYFLQGSDRFYFTEVWFCLFCGHLTAPVFSQV